MLKLSKITLAHGSGGRLTHDLVRDLFAKYFKNEYLSPLTDSAEIRLAKSDIAFTTDSYVVKPLKFPGGDIGKLAICGTVNDLAVVGANPLFISCGFIIEEGLEFGSLEEIVESMARTAREAGVQVVTGDTKVVEKGSADGLFINTSGIGIKMDGVRPGYDRVGPGDAIIVNGNIGDHGMAVMAAREGLGLKTTLKSDCAPLNGLIKRLITAPTNRPTNQHTIKFLRDPTRGGLATTLCEIAEQTGYEIEINEKSIPVSDEVKGIAEILGIDPLYSANEGKVVIIVSEDSANEAIKILRNDGLGKNAQIIGRVGEKTTGRVILKTSIGTHRQIMMLTGDQLPRIC